MITFALYFVLIVLIVFYFLLNKSLKKNADLQAQLFKCKQQLREVCDRLGVSDEL